MTDRREVAPGDGLGGEDSFAAITRALQASPSVLACAVLGRTEGSRPPQPVAYVVPVTTMAAVRCRAEIRGIHPGLAIVMVSRIPLTADGAVDEAALRGLPVLDEALVVEVSRRLSSDPTVLAPEVRIDCLAPTVGAVHLWDAVPALVRKVPSVVARTAEPAAAKRTVVERPSVVAGATLAAQNSGARTLAETLLNAATDHQDHGVTYLSADGAEERQSYPALLAEASAVLAGLRAQGLAPGALVLLQCDRNRDFIPAFWGAVLGGYVPVPVAPAPSYEDDGSTVSRFFASWALLHQPLVVAGDRLASEIAAAGRRRGAAGLRIAAIGDLRRHAPDARAHPAQPFDVALLMLTSGSTGQPKGVPLTHANLLARAEGSRQMLGFSAADVTFNWMPLDHVAGIIYFHLRDVFLGARQIHAQTDVVLQNPLAWIDAMDRHRVTVTFAPNFAFGLVNERADAIRAARWDLSCLRCVLNGAEAIVARTARRFLALLAPHGLPASAMHPAWGMSETSSGVVYGRRFSLDTTTDDDPFVEVGEPIPGMSIRVVDDAGQPVEESAIGRLQVTGTTVTSGYYERPDLNVASFTADGWFDTGDLAMIRDRQLTITGREKDDIVINSVKYYSHDVEAAVEELATVSRSFTAACAVRPAGADSEELAVFVVPADAQVEWTGLIADVRRAVARRLGVPPTYVLPVGTSDIPKTSIGKIQRSQLRSRFESGGFLALVKTLEVLTRGGRSVPDWFFAPAWVEKVLPPTDVSCPVLLAFVDTPAQRALVEDAFPESAVWTIARGEVFSRNGRAFTVRGNDVRDYVDALRVVLDEDGTLGPILHLWQSTGDETTHLSSPGECAWQALALVQAIAAIRADGDDVVLTFVSSGTGADDGTRVVTAARQMVRALLRTVVQELPWLDARHVWLRGCTAVDAVQALRRELLGRDGERDIAYGGHARTVARLKPLDTLKAPLRPLPFVDGGFYVISGGLGGMSLELGRFLIERGARLLLLGRTPLPSAPAEGTEGADSRLRRFEQLAAPGTVRYAAVDIADEVAVRAAVAECVQAWHREPDGVLHLAGVFAERLLVEESQASFTGALRAKVEGTVVLWSLVANRPDALFFVSSSVNGWFGGMAAGAYAAANAFVDSFVGSLPERPSVHAVAWSLWDEVGMSRGLGMKDRASARGYLPVSPTQGLNSFLVALSRTSGSVLAGLDSGAPSVSVAALGPCVSLDRISVLVEGAAVSQATRACDSLDLHDRFGTPVRAVATARVKPGAKGPAAAAHTAAEHTIAAAWRRVLRLDDIDVNTNFFDLGGTSLLMAQVYRELAGGLPVPVSLTDLFACPTIRSLALRVGDGGTDAMTDLDRDRGRERRERMRRVGAKARR